MAEEEIKYTGTRQKWSIEKHFENVDLDEVRLQIFEEGTDNLILDMDWNAKDFFKQMLDLQYEYAK